MTYTAGSQAISVDQAAKVPCSSCRLAVTTALPSAPVRHTSRPTTP
ncbi:Uncharacterised protein [Klebsiella variicola]|nr:Uncharacterised protein [Klebsiella variicola]